MTPNPSSAHARLMFRKEVLRPDAIAAVICIESSMTASAILDNVGNAMHSTFTDNPDHEYAKQEQIILAALKLDIAPNRNGSGAAAGTAVGRGNPSSAPQVPDLPGRVSTGRRFDENCVTLTAGKRARERENSLQTRGEAVGPSDHPRNESQRVQPSLLRAGDHNIPLSAPPSKQMKNSTQNILEKLKSRGQTRGGDDQPDSREETVANDEKDNSRDKGFTEELVLSSQYSLP